MIYKKKSKKITQLRKGGLSYQEIGEILGLSKQRIYQIVNYTEKKLEQRKKVVSHYSNGLLQCKKCGCDLFELLQIDHINSDGAEHRKTIKGSIYEWLIQYDFPNGFQILCANCNWLKYNYPRIYQKIIMLCRIVKKT